MSNRGKNSSKLKVEKNQTNLSTFVNKPSPVASSTPKKRAQSSPELNPTSAKRRPIMMEPEIDKNKPVTLLQLEQMEERMTRSTCQHHTVHGEYSH